MRLPPSCAVLAVLLATTLPAHADEPGPKTEPRTSAVPLPLMIAGSVALFAASYGARMSLYADMVEGGLWPIPGIGGWAAGLGGLAISVLPYYGSLELAGHSVVWLALGSLEIAGIGGTIAGIVEAVKPTRRQVPAASGAWTVRPYLTGQSAGITARW